MKKINKKGFSLVELLATIVILGILSSVSIVAYSRYKDKAKTQIYETLAKSAMHAMEEYMMDNPGETEATINTLYEEQYLERPADASDTTQECTGNVEANLISPASGEDKLDIYDFTVNLCCSNTNYQYVYNHNATDPPKPVITTCP